MAAEPEPALDTGRDEVALAVRVTPMRRRHLRAVLRIENQTYARPWTTALFLSELGLRATRCYLVARVGRRVVGYAGLMMSNTDGHVTTIAVDPRHRRRRIGTRLLLALARDARARQAERLTLEVRMSAEGAQELYRRFGFKSAGVRKHYYTDTNEDALIMWSQPVGTDAYAQRLARIEGEAVSRC